MNDRSGLLQAIRGPIMLIVLGTLVELDYAGHFAFWRTWPVLIIVFGLLKLMERASVKPAPYVRNYPGNTPPGGNAI